MLAWSLNAIILLGHGPHTPTIETDVEGLSLLGLRFNFVALSVSSHSMLGFTTVAVETTVHAVLGWRVKLHWGYRRITQRS